MLFKKIKDVLLNKRLEQDEETHESERDALFGILMGLVSLIMSSAFILVHYDFITCIKEGGWMEFFFTLFPQSLSK